MGVNQTTLKEGDNLPSRGKAFKTVLFDAMRKESLLDLSHNSTRDQAQEAFITHAAKRAFNPKDNASPTILKEFISKSFPGLKPTLEKIHFDFPEDGTPTEKSLAVVQAISNGSLPADIGQIVIGIIKDSVIIEEGTDLKARIEEIEKKLNAS